MKTTILDARTVAIVKPLETTKRNGANGEFESKTILLRIAVDRDYKTTRTENGKTISEYPTDFWLAKATGAVAQAIADNCAQFKDDGKLVSRHLLLNGSFEGYQSTRKQKINAQPQVNINGQIYQLNLDLDVDVPTNNTIFVIDSFRFLDKKPGQPQANTGTTTATVASVMPVSTVQTMIQNQATPAPAQPVTQVMQQQPASAPQQAQPVEVVANQGQPVMQVAPPAGAGITIAPMVGDGFVATGKVAPF